MPKEIRNPKSDWPSDVLQSERADSAFWNWGDVVETNGYILHDEAASKSPTVDLMERTAQFGERIIRFTKKIPRGIKHPENNRLIDQLAGAATSVGAHYCEADDSVSGRDFKCKIGISCKESKETMFFLRMVAASEESVAEEVRGPWREAKELNLIFGSIWRKKG